MCQSPIWIRNRAYSSRTISLTDRKVLLKNQPWDYFTQRLMVPCGRCEECLRQQRNDWYVRLERETKYHKSLHHNSLFVTITIAPEYYDSALKDGNQQCPKTFLTIKRYLFHNKTTIRNHKKIRYRNRNSISEFDVQSKHQNRSAHISYIFK